MMTVGLCTIVDWTVTGTTTAVVKVIGDAFVTGIVVRIVERDVVVIVLVKVFELVITVLADVISVTVTGRWSACYLHEFFQEGMPGQVVVTMVKVVTIDLVTGFVTV